MMCFGGLGLGCTHCVASSAMPAATKTCENAEGQIVGLHGRMAIYISATIRLPSCVIKLCAAIFYYYKRCLFTINLINCIQFIFLRVVSLKNENI